VHLTKPLAIFVSLLFFNLFLLSATEKAYAINETSTAGVTNFAFASYLGTGFYTTSGQNVFVLQLPFEYTINKKNDTEAGWLLNLPITIGFINFDDADFDNLPEVPELDDVATLTFMPGLEYQYPVTPDWTLIPFADYGFARDMNNTTNVLITGIGIKSYFNVHFDKNLFTLGNRILYARERSQISSDDSSYSLIETGLNYRIPTDSASNDPLFFNFYYINFYYPNDLVFFQDAPNPIRVGVENELGITLSNIPDFLFFEKSQIGLGVRFGNDVNAYRIVFGMPF
jgi:hypothetical protein